MQKLPQNREEEVTDREQPYKKNMPNNEQGTAHRTTKLTGQSNILYGKLQL